LAQVIEPEGSRGYAIALEGLVTYINDLLPNSETIGGVYRQTNAPFPKIAIREIIAKANDLCLIITIVSSKAHPFSCNRYTKVI
jgi:hypothetical protein